MISIGQALGPLCPPLRLVLTTRCNGVCLFCHHEGLPDGTRYEMTPDVLYSAVVAARALGLTRITLSGGEPTLMSDLPIVVERIRSLHPGARVGLVTNGYGLDVVWERLRDALDAIDVSIHSIERYEEFTHVRPADIMALVACDSDSTPRPNVTVNCVLHDANAHELPEIVNLAQENSCSLTVMTIVPEASASLSVTRAIAWLIEAHSLTHVVIGCTPTLQGPLPSGGHLRLKLPYLSSIPRWRRCLACEERDQCGEFFCALRVFPDGGLSTCRTMPVRIVAATPDSMRQAMAACLADMTGAFSSWTELLPYGFAPARKSND